MPADIAETASGTAAAMYARDPAWHGLGFVKEATANNPGGHFTAQEALAGAHLDFDVESQPVTVETEEGVTVSTRHKVNYAKIDGNIVILGPVGSDYTATSPRTLFQFLDDVVGNVDGSHYVSAAALREFTQVFICADLGELNLDPQGRNDKIATHIFACTGFDGSMAFEVKFCPWRIECANMLRVARSMKNFSGWKTKHTKDVLNRIEAAQKTLGLWRDYTTEWEEVATELIQAEITNREYDKFVEGLFTVVAAENKDDEVDQEALSKARILYEYGKQNDNVRGTVWGALNAATEFGDWYTKVSGGKKTTEKEMVFLRQIGDSPAKYGQKFKETAFEYARDFARDVASVKVGV